MVNYLAGGFRHNSAIKRAFQEQDISFACALKYMIELGMTEFAAEQYLYAE